MAETTSTPTPAAQAAPPPDTAIAKENPVSASPSPGESAKSANPVAEAAKEAARKLKIKHQDGSEEEVDEEEVIKTYRERKGHQRAANKELQEGKAERKKAEEALAMLRDPEKFWDIASKLHQDPKVLRSLAEKRLAADLEDELMDPRDKELREAKAKLKQIDDMERKEKEEVAARHREEMKQKYAKEYETQFIEALKKKSVPATKQTVADMAKYIARAAKIGYQLNADQAAQLVREDREQEARHLYGQSDGEVLASMLGEDVINNIRKYDVAKLKDPNAGLKTVADPNHVARDRQPKATGKKMTHKEWNLFKRGLK